MRWLSVVTCMLGCSREAPHDPASPAATQAQLHFTGDTYFGESYRAGKLSDEARYERSLARLGPLLSTGPVIGNLESTLFEPVGEADSDLAGRKTFLHWSHRQNTVAALVQHGFVGVSLANNHAMDFGLAALEQTRSLLSASGLHPFGAGSTTSIASEPFTLSVRTTPRNIDVAIIGAYWFRPRYAKEYAFYADHHAGGVRELNVRAVTKQIRRSKAEAPHRAVVVFPHWGRNYRWRNQQQQRLARVLIDAGADLVIGHGAHVLQEVERYRDRWILYGLGNLVFLSPGRYQHFDAPALSLIATVRWSSHAEAELVLRFIDSDNLDTDYQPHVVDDDRFDAALSRLSNASCRRPSNSLASFCSMQAQGRDEYGRYVRMPLRSFDPR